MLESKPNILALWAGWEHGAFDGKDADFAGKSGYDATGRYVPYWVRGGNGQITNTALIDYATASPGDYYQLPFTTQKTIVIEPCLAMEVNALNRPLSQFELGSGTGAGHRARKAARYQFAHGDRRNLRRSPPPFDWRSDGPPHPERWQPAHTVSHSRPHDRARQRQQIRHNMRQNRAALA